MSRTLSTRSIAWTLAVVAAGLSACSGTDTNSITVGGDVPVEPVERIASRCSADAGVVEFDLPPRIARVIEVFDVLRVEALVRDTVAEKDDAVAFGEVHAHER